MVFKVWLLIILFYMLSIMGLMGWLTAARELSYLFIAVAGGFLGFMLTKKRHKLFPYGSYLGGDMSDGDN